MWAFQMALVLKNQPANAGDVGSIPGSGRSPGEGNGNPLQYPWPGESHGGRSLVGYSPWGGKELDTTERLHFTCGYYPEVVLRISSLTQDHNIHLFFILIHI